MQLATVGARRAAVDEQLLVLEHRVHRLAAGRHALVPGADVRGAVGVGDDRGEARASSGTATCPPETKPTAR